METTPGGARPSTSPVAELIDRLIAVAIEDRRIRALWIEAETPRELRRPYGRVTVHAVADEPDFQSLAGDWERILARGAGAGVRDPRWSETPRSARLLEAEIAIEGLGSAPARFVIECSAFLAKRPRRSVVVLADKTGHLLHVMDFARRD
jgi:hypothetical protein